MKKRVFVVTIMLLAAGAMQAGAQDATTGPKTKTLTAKITGTATLESSSQQCDAGSGDYADKCPVGPCQCFSVTGAKVTGSMAGKGTADLVLSDDTGQVVTDPVSTHGCSLVYGIVNFNNTTLKKVPLTEKVDVLGTTCHHTKSGKPDTEAGGFAIEAGASNNASGWGTYTGTFDPSTFAVSLKTSGSITQ